MHLTFRMLQVFDAVARHLSYTRAAQELHLTQPAVSMQIRQLEEATGVPLFEQLGKRIYLTRAGQEMHYYTHEIQRLLGEAESVLSGLQGGTRGRLEISVASTANHFATRLLAAFARRYPDVSYSLDVTNRETLVSQLVNNLKDLVLMGRPPPGLDLEVEAFMANPLVVIAPPDHPLARQESVTLDQLQQERFVVRERGSGTRIAMERFFEAQGIQLNTDLEMTSNEAIKQAVQAGLGLGIVSIHTLEIELEAGRLQVLDVEHFPILRHWYLVYRKGKRLSPVARNFRDFVLKHASSFVRQ